MPLLSIYRTVGKAAKLLATHQLTPDPSSACSPLQALQPEPADGQKEQDRPPRGGFTDVGLHTGGSPRDTAWPLVWQAFKVRQGRGLATG